MISVAISLVALVLSVASWVGYRQMWDKRDLASFTDTLYRVETILDRMETATFVVASDLSTAQHVVDKVASDLADSQQRADQIIGGHPGAAADAGAQSGT